MDLEQIRSEMKAIITDARANIQNGKPARSEDVREPLVKLATAILTLTDAAEK